jgi:hypothetical protein
VAERKVVYVLSHGTEWRVKCDHCTLDRITRTQAEAISQARAHVRSLPAGTLSQILVQRDDGKFREEWTYGKDPYPPVG